MSNIKLFDFHSPHKLLTTFFNVCFSDVGSYSCKTLVCQCELLTPGMANLNGWIWFRLDITSDLDPLWLYAVNHCSSKWTVEMIVAQQQKRKFPASCSSTNAGRFIVGYNKHQSWITGRLFSIVHKQLSLNINEQLYVLKRSHSAVIVFVFNVQCFCLRAQIEYFLRKLTDAMGGSWVEERFEDYRLQLNSKQQCLNVWELISLVGSGHFSKGIDHQTLSMGINEVYQELILDVLKQVGSKPAHRFHCHNH